MEDNLKKIKMEDDFNFSKSKMKNSTKMEDNLKKNEKNGREPQKK